MARTGQLYSILQSKYSECKHYKQCSLITFYFHLEVPTHLFENKTDKLGKFPKRLCFVQKSPRN